MHSTAYDTIKAAMKSKQQVICTYGGHSRELCVHTIGTSADKEMMLAYQFGGQSSSSFRSDQDRWRCMEIAKVGNVSVRDGSWHTAANHSKSQTCVKDVDFEVGGSL